MTSSDDKRSAVDPEEDRFVQRALAKAERTVRFDQIKQIVVMLIVFPGLYYFMGKAPQNPVQLTVIFVLGLMLVAITVKIVGLINKNTRMILQAIADISRK
jgi:hypothetical protein